MNEDHGPGPSPEGDRSYSLDVDRAPLTGDRVLRLTGSIDWSHSSALLAELVRAAEEADSPVVVDLAGLTFADSPLLHVLLDLQRTCRARGLPFHLSTDLHPVVERLFTVTGALGYFELTARRPGGV
ncbi:STAS domain-containing protein [Streptomyces sp. NPDC060194]|uniref:STAS domain-containing protein n=1 Tax=Streptomyces sp. NPDC060194 TaxID=3347069 RepID=UPI0036488657